MSDLDEFRRMKDTFFASDPASPLFDEEQAEFSGLKYFPENPALRLTLKVVRDPEREKVRIETTDGDTQTYARYGRFSFEIDGQPVGLTLYQGAHGFFLPFADALAGKETYPAGRYLEPEPAGPDRFHVDFNLAYNPYCAYSDRWSCPITPAENRLKVAIRAGEKLYHPAS
jgi:uncharacterized protein (DUF1684 family)